MLSSNRFRARQRPEFIGRALDQWAYTRGVRLHVIAPGEPVQNAHIESFHGRFRDECLNESWLVTLADPRRIVEAGRQDYNAMRPHSSRGYLTPEAFEQRTLTAAEPAGLSPSTAEYGGQVSTPNIPRSVRSRAILGREGGGPPGTMEGSRATRGQQPGPRRPQAGRT